LFPLGAMSKPEVREAALAAGFPIAHKLDSQEVCFVGGSGAGKFVMRQPEAQGDRSGKILDADGKELGTHDGIAGFTIGQRRGLGLGRHTKLHVLSIDAEAKTIVVGDEKALERSGLIGVRASWPSGQPTEPVRALARIRYRNAGTNATITPREGNEVSVHFDQPVSAVAPGQAVVFYAGEEVLGGAWIREAIA
jgi:tRNA-specific 2-thiouridylase